MEKKIFSVFFLAIPVVALLLLTIVKLFLKGEDFWSAFESLLPILIFYYMGASIIWMLNLEKIKKVTSTKV